jgi:hypothetical protein
METTGLQVQFKQTVALMRPYKSGVKTLSLEVASVYRALASQSCAESGISYRAAPLSHNFSHRL